MTILALQASRAGADHCNRLCRFACRRTFHIITIQALGVVLIEGGRHGHNLLELIANGLDILLLEHLGIHGCLIGVLRIHIPTAKHDIIELSQGHDVGIVQITGIGTTTNAYLIVLSH